MNPWWRRPAADEKPEKPRKPQKAQPDAKAAEAGNETPAASEPDDGPENDAAATAEAVEQPTPAATAEAADSGLAAPEGAASAPDAEEPAASAADEPVEAGEADTAGEPADASEAAVSPALEAATEPAVPAQPTTDAPNEDQPAPRRRRRRRGRRGGRGRGRGRKASEAKRQESEATPDTASEAAQVTKAPAKEVAEPDVAGDAAPAVPPFEAVPGRSAALLDLAAMGRSLGGAIEADALLARLDRDLGTLVLRRAYVDDRSGATDRTALHRGGAEIVDVPPAATEAERPATMRIVMDAIELAHTRQSVRTVVLVATGEMLPLIVRLQQAGVTVVGIGDGSGNARVRSQCDRFIDLSA